MRHPMKEYLEPVPAAVRNGPACAYLLLMVLDKDPTAPHPKKELLDRPLYALAKEDQLLVVAHLLAGCEACAAMAREGWKLDEPVGPHPLAPSPGGRGGNDERRFRRGLRLV